ncbi:MAG TPA: right-handed parallel beta-helix repeat-containing protein [Oscillatoriaceae cyanobacterium M33_DOE_052]|uniref:DUF1565 domain-containing protein n=1 Tax=Planktothricoides sp. SpSt-374 TaxID=2282167 RepID=A0A7C3ZHS9_9CYAN|nr:right-handed parallel beta-helix repeat-containing protein [Oscillatoriaceae cyanobacterium M33_DOE_052]
MTICCLNPDCQNPTHSNLSGTEVTVGGNCEQCNAPLLLLRNRYRPIESRGGGAGGVGKTYLAEDADKGNEKCIIKQFVPPIPGKLTLEKVKERFEQRARELQQLGEYPQIPTLLAYFEENGGFYSIYQFIEGESLAAQLHQQNTFSPEQVAAILRECLGILKFIHEKGVIHGDIKPENILTSRNLMVAGEKTTGQLVLIDFAFHQLLTAVALPELGISSGDWGYQPLEHLEDGESYPESDLYGLGVTGYQLLTGGDPAAMWQQWGYGWTSQWRSHLPIGMTEAPQGVSRQLIPVLDRLLQPDYRQRYHAANLAEADLAEPITPPIIAPTPIEELKRGPLPAWTRRRFVQRTMFAAGGVVVGLALHAVGSELLENTKFLTVSKRGRGFRTINDAIKKAEPGAKITVMPGVYQESIVIDKPLEIVGKGPADQIQIESSEGDCIIMKTDSAVVKGITFHGEDKQAYAVYVTQGELILENCTIASDTLAGVGIFGAGVCQIRRCQIKNGKGAGVLVSDGAVAMIEDCQISGNAHAGVEIKQGGNPVIRRCEIKDGKQSGIFVHSKGLGVIEDCQISGNKFAGVEIKAQGNPLIRRCQINKNQYYAVFVHKDGTGTIEASNLSGNGRGPWRIDAGAKIEQKGNQV